MKEAKVKVLKVMKDGVKTVTSIEKMDNELKEFQSFVGGYIEVTA